MTTHWLKEMSKKTSTCVYPMSTILQQQMNGH